MAASVSCRVRAGGASASGPRRCCVLGDEGFSRRSARPHPVRAAGSHKSNVTPPPGVLEWERNQELVTELHGKAGSAVSRPRCAVCAIRSLVWELRTTRNARHARSFSRRPARTARCPGRRRTSAGPCSTSTPRNTCPTAGPGWPLRWQASRSVANENRLARTVESGNGAQKCSRVTRVNAPRYGRSPRTPSSSSAPLRSASPSLR
jgi:hypothetical protein